MTRYYKTKAPEEKFRDSIIKKKECWIWKFINFYGYGIITIHSKRFLAHRYSWEIHKGPIPKGLFVLHKCDNPPCVNPDHLFLGTQTDNMQDAARKGRTTQGEKHANHKLTADEVLKIRELHKPKIYGLGCRALGRRFGVSKECIDAILARRSWKHI